MEDKVKYYFECGVVEGLKSANSALLRGIYSFNELMRGTIGYLEPRG